MRPNPPGPPASSTTRDVQAQNLFERLPAALIEVDDRLIVRRANERGAQAFGRGEPLEGRPLFEATLFSRALEPALRAVLESSEPYTFWGYPIGGEGGQGPVSFWDVTLQRMPGTLPGDGRHEGWLLLFAVDVTARVEAERGMQDAVSAARQAAEKLRATFEQMVDGVLLADRQGRAHAANDAARSIFGDTISLVEGPFDRPGVLLLTPSGAPVARDELPWVQASSDGRVVAHGEFVIQRRPNESATVSVSAAPLADDKGQRVGAVAVVRDVTATHRAMAELRQANLRLEENSRLKNEFVANMSHELRTPLNAILGFASLLRSGAQGELTDLQADAVGRILRNGKSLLILIDGVLDVARIEAGVRTLHPEHFDLVESVQAAFGELESLAQQKKLAYTMRVEGEFALVFTDRGRLRQIVINLLSNALKFTSKGSIELVLMREGDAAIIEVRDTGVGIRPEHLGLIFEKFRQVDGSTTRTAGGIGLGLNIVRELTELLGGRVDVRSTFGVGSTFRLWLPLDAHTLDKDVASVPDEGAAEALDANEDADPSRPLVLVVEDNLDSGALLRTTLEQAGFRVKVAENGVAGLRLARTLLPAAITLDIMMPRMDGWRVLQALRDDPATARIPVIVCSIVDNRLLGYRLGASEYLTKPVEPNALLSALARVGASPHPDTSDDVLVVDDERALREVVGAALEQAGYSVRQARSGEEALRLVAERRPRAIFVDMIMPGGMSGFEMLARLRNDPLTADIPVVVLTGRDVTTSDRRQLHDQLAHVVRAGDLGLPELSQRLRDVLPSLGVAPGPTKR